MGITRSAVGRSAARLDGRILLDGQTTLCAMAGNPNVGKSSLFNALTGLHQHTGNWTGKTVGCTVGKLRVKKKHTVNHGTAPPQVLLADLPGCYSLQPASAEEQAALDFLMEQPIRAVVVVCETSNLARNLLLAYQIRALQRPFKIIVCVNLMDEAEARGRTVNADALAETIGCPVVLTSARDGRGVDELKRLILETCAAPAEIREPMNISLTHAEILPASHYREAASHAATQCIIVGTCSHTPHQKRTERADRFIMGKWTAIPVALGLLTLVLWLTVTGANIPSSLLSRLFASWGSSMAQWELWTHVPPWVSGLLLDGVYRTLTWVVAVMLPPMAIFFPLFTLMEDIGLLPRLAFNFDRCFHACKACGKQALTMCMGLGCNAAGVTGCRIIDSPRERMIAILTNTLVPCNGKFPTLLAMTAIFFSAAGQGTWQGNAVAALLLSGFLCLSLAVTLAVSLLLSQTLLKGHPSAFILEIPPYRKPRIGQVLVRSLLDRTLLVLGRAVTVAAPAGAILWILANVSVGGTGLLTLISGWLEPTAWILCVDGAILLAMILSMPANELTLPILLMIYASGGVLTDYSSLSQLDTALGANGWTLTTAVAFTALFLFHVPCTTTLLTVKKETGQWRWVLAAAIIPLSVGVFFCLLIRIFSLI